MRLPSRLLIIVAAGMLLGLTMLGATDRLPGAAAGVDAQDEARNTVMLPFVPASDTPTEILLPTPTSTVAPTPTGEETPAATPTPTWTAPATIPPTPTLPPPTPPIGTVYYLAPAGNDGRAGTSPATAWATFDRAWESLFPGDVLVLLDGVYHQSLAPGVRDGEPGAPITIRAAHDGQAIIDGDFVRVPVQLGPWPGATRDYFVIEGIVARNSSDHVYDINGSHNVLRRVSGYNANRDANSHVFILTGTDTLLEDCIASGTGRKMAFTWGGQRNTIRRCFTNWQRYDGREFNSDWPWGEDLEFYNSSDSIMENSISYGSPPKTAVSVYGNIDSANGSTPYSYNDQVLGVMVVRNGVYKDGTFWEWPLTRPQPTDNDVIAKIHEWAGWRLGFGVILWGEAAEVKDILFQDIFAWRNAGLGLAEIHPFNRSENVTVNRATIIENGLDAVVGEGGPGTNVDPDQIAHYAVTDARIDGTAHQDGGAQLVYRYVDGVLMDGSNGGPALPLWPWPMQDRVLTELGIDVTGELTAILMQAGVPTGTNVPAPTIAPMPPPANVIDQIGPTTYLAPVQVTLSTTVADAQIRYTTDGRDPDASAPLYTGPFTVASSAIVKAKTFVNGAASHAVSAFYKIEPGRANVAPVVTAALLPFVYPAAQIMLPTSEIGLYGTVEDQTFATGDDRLTTGWSLLAGPGPVTFDDAAAPRTRATFAQPGVYLLRLTADDGALTAHSDVTVEVLPQGGNRVTLPGRVEAENYKDGGEGVGYHDLTFGNFAQVYRTDGVDLNYAYNEWTGYSLVHMDPGEWTAYDVAVSEPGVYALTARVAGAMDGGVFHVEVDGVDISGPIVVPYTNDGLRIYTDVTKQTPALAAGNHELRIVIDRAPDGADQLFAAVNYLDFAHTGSAQAE